MKFKRQTIEIREPRRAHVSDAGYDLFSPYDVTVMPGKCSERINLGVAFEIPPGFCGVVSERSSQGVLGVFTVGNIVDSGYTGWVHVTLVNMGEAEYRVGRGEKICQIYFSTISTETLEEAEKFNPTDRGEAAHGSTGNL